MPEAKKGPLNELVSETDPINRLTTLYFLYCRVAAGMENFEKGSDQIGESMGDIWTRAAEKFDGIVEESPKDAFDISLWLTMLPKNEDKRIEDVYKWMRGDGPVMLSRSELKNHLLEYIDDNEKSEPVMTKLLKNIAYDFSEISNRDEASQDPNCYLSLGSILLGMRLKDSNIKNAEALSQAAESRLGEGKVQEIINYYKEIPDTEWLADELKSFEVK